MWVWQQAGASISGLTSAAGSFYTYGVDNGTWHSASSGYSPQPGDAVLYGLDTASASAAHVGIVNNWPDVIQGNFSDSSGTHWEVRDDPTGIDVGETVSGWVSPVPDAGTPPPAVGTILGSQPRAFYIAQNDATAQVGSIPNGTQITVDCTVSGQPTTGPYGTETTWDRTNYGGSVGFVSDAWVYTGTNNPAFPPCGGNAVAMEPGCVPIHEAPSNASTSDGCIPQATSLTIDCTANGDSNSGPFGATNLWDHTNFNGETGYVTDAYMYTGTASAVAGQCPAITPPQFGQSSIPALTVGRPFSTYLTVSAGAGPYTWSIASGSLPTGLTLGSAGAISGNPTRAGSYSVTIDVTDSESLPVTAARTFTGTVAPGTLRASTPTLTGTAKVGGTLTAHPGSWTAGATLLYRWYAAGKTIAGATRSTFKLTSSQVGKAVTVKVTGKKAGYTAVTKTSAATKKVAR